MLLASLWPFPLPPLPLNDICLHHALLTVLLHPLNLQGIAAEVGHGLPEGRVQEHLAHHVALQGAGVALQVVEELLPGQVQVFSKHVDVQVIPWSKRATCKNVSFGVTRMILHFITSLHHYLHVFGQRQNVGTSSGIYGE